MKLAPATSPAASPTFEDTVAVMRVGQLAMAAGLAQLEWSGEATAAALPISGLLYHSVPGLHPARGREFQGLHGFSAR